MSSGQETNSLKARLQKDMKNHQRQSEDLMNVEFENFERSLKHILESALATIAKDTNEFSTMIQHQNAVLQQSQKELIQQIEGEIKDTAKSLISWRMKIAGIIAISWISGVILTTILAMILMSLALPEKFTVKVPVNSPSLMEYNLQGTKLIRGVGGVGVLVKLPANLQETACPPLAAKGGICLKAIQGGN